MTRRAPLTLLSTALLVFALNTCTTPPASTTPAPIPDTPPDRSLPRAEWGGMPVNISHQKNIWILAGQKQSVTFNAADFSLAISTPHTQWQTAPSAPNDLLLSLNNHTQNLPLTAARKLQITPYDPGFATGIQLHLSDFPNAPGLELYLTLALQGQAEDLLFTIVPHETPTATIRQLNWPPALDAHDVDCTILSNSRGVMLPRTWPHAYNPIRSLLPDGTQKYPHETTDPQSNVIEDWSMSWWGFQKGPDALMLIVETPDDAAYQFSHPAGGPTVIGPRWRNSLGQLRYERSCRLCFLPNANYVQMAKHYRDYVQSTGLFVSLKEKIARNPQVADLLGTPILRSGILTDIKSDSLRYSTTQPARNHHLTTFDERGQQYRQFRAQGIDRLNVVLTGWPHKGYDRQHPDELPPAPDAGGWEGMKRLEDTCHELGYLFSLHDQYRDYYTDAPSFNRDFANHEQDAASISPSFPGSRFGQWKEGVIPFMNNWDGGKQTSLNNRLMPGELQKNYEALFAHGIHPDGIYLDVFGYVPPDEDFHPEHPTTRTDALRAHALAYAWARHNIGVIGTEAGCDWTIPFTDYTSPLNQSNAIPIPLFNLVYHDAVITPYSPDDLHGLLNAGIPQLSLPGRKGELADGGNPAQAGTFPPDYLINIHRMAALHQRLALCEMTNHEFLTPDRHLERTTFSDGTTVTVDWSTHSATISPPLPSEQR
jgi:hypothetical protein